MEITDTERDSRYENATPIQKQLYSSSEAGTKLSAIAQKYDLSSTDVYRKFAITVGDFILGFYKPEDFALVLEQTVGINSQMATLLAVDVKNFLAPLSSSSQIQHQETSASAVENHLPEITGSVHPPAPTPIIGAIEQPPSETVYTSTQAAILTEKPAEHFGDQAKWGTDK